MPTQIVFIGFGEAGQAFAEGMSPCSGAYDRKTDDVTTRAAKLTDFKRLGITPYSDNASAVAAADCVLSVVTADQALSAAEQSAKSIAADTLYCDLNSVAPDTKRAAAKAIETAGGRYVDVAVMAPVHPARRNVPLLISGPHANAGIAALAAAGFSDIRHQPGGIGAASSVKMIRSVMVKGLEALTTECVLAATVAGVRNEVIASLNASWPGTDWADKASYNLERMMVHGLRRAEEMQEVVKTLDGLGTGSAMARGTVVRQRAIGQMRLDGIGSFADRLQAILADAGEEAE